MSEQTEIEISNELIPELCFAMRLADSLGNWYDATNLAMCCSSASRSSNSLPERIFKIAKGLKHHTRIHCDLVHQLRTSVLVDLYILLTTSEKEENSAYMMSTCVHDLNDLVDYASDSLDIRCMLEQLGSCFYESDRCSCIAITRSEHKITRPMTLYTPDHHRL